ncbi:hypothetical protein J6S37_00530 [Candidatus Saccharibacteria bacterium]|nr:hypothetical protein [Candidatus Saccharibacteria bacterium]
MNRFTKIFKKSIYILLITLTFSFSLISPALAEDKDNYITPTCDTFLGLTSWSCGVVIKDESTLKNGIWQIVANIAADITVVAAYLVLGYVIYGGYRYIFSGGDVGKVATGKKTLVHAFIGLAIVLSANLIMGTIRIVLVGGNLGNCISETTTCVTPDQLVTNLVNWFISIAGLISAIFLVYGAVSYITSFGDSTKTQKAKQAILYSLIGLAIVALAFGMTAFVSTLIRDANENAEAALLINQITT